MEQIIIHPKPILKITKMKTETKIEEIERKINWLKQQIDAACNDGDFGYAEELEKDLHYFQDKLTIAKVY